jgi:hypothetical protein
MPPVRLSVEAHSGIIAEVTTGTDEVAAALATGRVPYGIVAGAGVPCRGVRPRAPLPTFHPVRF